MNKRYLYIFCIVGLLLVASVAVMLIGSIGGWTTAMDKTVLVTVAQTEATAQNTTQEQTVPGETQQNDGAEKTPDFEVAFGVGDGQRFDDKTQTQGEQKPLATTTPVTTKPTQGENTESTQTPVAGENGKPDKLLRYEEFLALSNAQQQAYFNLFEDPLEYAKWLQKAQQEYEDGKTSITVTGPVDISTLPAEGN